MTVLGGTVSVMAGDAADGAQFIRFTPEAAENALILKLGSNEGKGRDRRLEFAARLVGATEQTRLVLSTGQTLALRPSGAGVEVEVAGVSTLRLPGLVDASGWLRLVVNEDTAKGTWDLYIGGVLAARGLPQQDDAEVFSDLLVFADGALDVDAVRVSAIGAGGANDHPADGAGGKKAGEPEATNLTAEAKSGVIAQALELARADDFVPALKAVHSLTRTGKKPAERDLELAQTLSLLAFALHDEGQYRAATVLAHEALHQLRQARVHDAVEGGTRWRATYEFIAAQLTEEILGDTKEAERLYRQAVVFDPEHSGAKGGADRMLRQKGGQVAGPSGGGR